MQNEFDQHFAGLLTTLREMEVEQKKRYDGAIDIEDMSEAISVAIDARNKIQQLRKWIEDIQRIRREVESANLTISHQEMNKLVEGIAAPEAERPIPEEFVLPKADDELDNKSPQEFSLFGKLYSVNDWQELLIKLCETMILKEPYKFMGLSVLPMMDNSERRILSIDEQQILEPRTKLSNGLYVTTVGSPYEIKTRCERILKACGYNSDVLQISDGGQ